MVVDKSYKDRINVIFFNVLWTIGDVSVLCDVEKGKIFFFLRRSCP